MDFAKLKKLTKLIRYYILTSTTKAGSGHPSTCLSAVELMTVLFFGGFYRYDFKKPKNPKNHRVLFSKGHAAPLLYSLYTAAGAISYGELLTLRKITSDLEGHPTPRFTFTESPTGSLGQGLSIGLGMALAGAPRVYVLLGDSEIAEGNVWEAIELASYYKVNNLVGILDVNRLGQSDETMLGWDIDAYKKRIENFGWYCITLEDGHDLQSIYNVYKQAQKIKDKPQMIIAKTIKGKGVSFMENKNGWHGKPLDDNQLTIALKELGEIDTSIRGRISTV